MQIVRTKSELQAQLDKFRQIGKTIGFVPTMGALHTGHMSLVEIAKEAADIVVVSIFVNPTQFAPNEDFDKYPRTIESDLQKLEPRNVDVVYLPDRAEIYPDGFDQNISTGKIGQQLEGVTRPHFFDGVATVVTQLFLHTKPDVAVFGQKDFQQLHIICKLDNNVKIIGAPIIREEDGLAMSSRNAYLSAEHRKIAPNLYKTLNQVAQKIISGENLNKSIAQGKASLIQNGFTKVDYLEMRDASSLLQTKTTPSQLLAAVYLGNTRLIDNIFIG